MVFPKQIKKKDPNDAHKEKLTWKKLVEKHFLMSESQEKHKRMVKRMKYILTEFEVRTWVADRVFPLVIMAQARSAGHKSEKTRFRPFRTLLYGSWKWGE